VKSSKSTAFFCSECGNESSKWMGQCPACKAWNTLVEERVVTGASGIGGKRAAQTIGGSLRGAVSDGQRQKPMRLQEIDLVDQNRSRTGIKELDRVLGGGIVAGSLVLVGGDPGIGKSTLLLQVCRNLSLMGASQADIKSDTAAGVPFDNIEKSSPGKKILYISGEESLAQIKLRALRIGDFGANLKLLCETNLALIEEAIVSEEPEVVVIDSIQTMFLEEIASAPGSVSQVREATGVLLRLAKGMGIPIFIVGHVTKEGTVAGPRVLEHMVDTVLYFEGDRHASYRVLRAVKNRFGSTNEIGVFEMIESGLKEVTNPSEYMLAGKPENASGSVVVCSIEGSRPILVEVQALVSQSNLGIPRRQATGCDINRVNLLIAVLEKRLNVPLGGCDAYVNVAGGIKMNEPAMDLGVVTAICSSFKNKPIDDKTIFFGEVGLSGEVRSVSQAIARVNEAAKLGFTRCVMPSVNLEQIRKEASIPASIKLIGVNSVVEAIKI